MAEMEQKELATVALAMSKEDRMIFLDAFPVEDLIEVVYLKYSDMKNRYEAIQSIFNDPTTVVGGN